MNLTRSASQVSTTSELLQRNSGARWAAPKDDDPPSPPAKPPPLTKGKSTKIKRRGTSLALASGERVHMQAQAWGRGRHGQLGSIDEQSDGLRAQAAGLPQPIFTDVHVHAAACGADFTLLPTPPKVHFGSTRRPSISVAPKAVTGDSKLYPGGSFRRKGR